MAHLVLPNGKGHGWRPDTPDHRDRSLSMKVSARAPVPPSLWLKPEALPKVRDQGPLGACTGFGTTGALMWSLKAKQLKEAQLSPLFAYYQGRVIEASVKEDSGCEIRDVVKAAANLGVCLERYMPYRIERFARAPTKTAVRNASSHQVKVGYYRCLSIDDILQAIIAGMPVVGGYSWFSCLDTADFERTGVMPLPGPRDRLEGGHCNWFCGFDDRARLLLAQNSYGEFGASHPVTGERGYVLMPYDYLMRNLADDFWAIDHE